jgi:hypothetical protein
MFPRSSSAKAVSTRASISRFRSTCSCHGRGTNEARLAFSFVNPDDIWPGIFGFEDTVLPQVERALIAGHDFVLLGERGQGKTRLIRSLVGLLDGVAGATLHFRIAYPENLVTVVVTYRTPGTAGQPTTDKAVTLEWLVTQR